MFLLAQPVNLVPQPGKIVYGEGAFVLDANTTLQLDAKNQSLKDAAGFFQSYVKNISGLTILVNGKQKKIIRLRIAPTAGIGEEGYLLDIKGSGVTLTANTKAGIINGFQTIFQLLPAVRTNALMKIPALSITDYPRFKWRGMHLDVSRHFFSPDLVKEYIDLMASYKLNVFHWHLVDDQGWRIEIKKYPKLTQVGAWRVDQTDKTWGERPQAKPGENASYGGYYTQQQIREIVAYAKERNVTVVPEIEMPGHVASAIAAYPYLSCSQMPQLSLTGGNYKNISSNYCAGNDSVFHFLENVLSEVIQLFPSAYIHVGGDEVDKTSWKNCPKCQARIKKMGLKNEEELQSYFISRMEKFLISKGRKLIGWDEILEGGLAPEATVMSWRGEAGGIAAAKMSHDVVMTPGYPLYFDHYQAGPEGEPMAFGGFNSVKNVYDYDPVPSELNAEQGKYILGAQANLWTEYITTAEGVEYMVLPRMLALSEVVWSEKTAKNWDNFNERLQDQFKAFDQKGLHYSKGNFNVNILPLATAGKLSVSLFTEASKGEIYYTTNGEQPTIYSQKYTGAIPIESSVIIKAAVAVDGKVMSPVPSTQSFELNLATGKNVTYTNPVNKSYPGTGANNLTDGIRGTLNVGKYWHGFTGNDLVATVDLGNQQLIHQLSLGCLQKYKDWIFMPQSVKFEVSEDGINYKEVGNIVNNVSPLDTNPLIKNYTSEFAPQKARYIRVTAKPLPSCPEGHPGQGKPAWLFTDEIMVN